MARLIHRGARRRRRTDEKEATASQPTASERAELRMAARERRQRAAERETRLRERDARRAAEREALERTAARKRGRRRIGRSGDRDKEAAAGGEQPAPEGAPAAQPVPNADRPPAELGEVPVVELRDVSKVYEGGVVGLQRVSLRIGRGEFVFLVGPTGCGKSTCVRLMLKELEPSAGSILISGHDLADMPRRNVPHLRRNIGTIFQDFKLLPNRTVYANVAYSLEVIGESRASIRRKVPDILRLVGLSTKLHAYPDDLSGGEQQRVSIARAFVNQPPILLADEPTGNLDPETSIGIMQLIYRINRTGTTVVVATHDKEMVDKMRRRVIELRDGRVIRDQASGLYRHDDESTREFGVRLRGELGVGVEGHPN